MRSKSKAEMLRIINSSPDAASIGLSADPGVTEVENAIDYLKRSTNSINKDLAKKAENILKNLVTTYS